MHALLDLDVIAIPKKAAILHCAPNESSLVHRFRAGADDYVPADFDPSRYPLPDIQSARPDGARRPGALRHHLCQPCHGACP